MSQTLKCQGKCLCGAVSIRADQVDTPVSACHCATCRRWGGGPFVAVDCGTAVQIDGEEAIAVYDSSEWAQRGFCRHCGTHLYYRLKQSGQYIIPVDLFEPDPAFRFAMQVFVDQKSPLYSFADQTKQLTGAEVFAMFASAEAQAPES